MRVSYQTKHSTEGEKLDDDLKAREEKSRARRDSKRKSSTNEDSSRRWKREREREGWLIGRAPLEKKPLKNGASPPLNVFFYTLKY